jgi:hypothetical protein
MRDIEGHQLKQHGDCELLRELWRLLRRFPLKYKGGGVV